MVKHYCQPVNLMNGIVSGETSTCFCALILRFQEYEIDMFDRTSCGEKTERSRTIITEIH